MGPAIPCSQIASTQTPTEGAGLPAESGCELRCTACMSDAALRLAECRKRKDMAMKAGLNAGGQRGQGAFLIKPQQESLKR